MVGSHWYKSMGSYCNFYYLEDLTDCFLYYKVLTPDTTSIFNSSIANFYSRFRNKQGQTIIIKCTVKVNTLSVFRFFLLFMGIDIFPLLAWKYASLFSTRNSLLLWSLLIQNHSRIMILGVLWGQLGYVKTQTLHQICKTERNLSYGSYSLLKC